MAVNVQQFQNGIRLRPISAAPSGATEGTLYYDSSDGSLKVRGASSFSDVFNAATLASNANGEGASLIGIEDAAGNYTATDVEAALAEVYTLASAGGSSDFSDADFRIQDNGDVSKQIAFEAAAITTATTRTITMPDADVDLADIATNTSNFSAHVDGAASKHDATEVDYERVDGSKKNIQAASDDVENALSDLDDAIGALDATPTNYTPTDASIVADHLAAIDSQLVAADDASEVSYTPAVLTDWDADSDPGNVDAALDQLAERVDDNEIAISNKAESSTVTEIDTNVDDLITLSGLAENTATLGAFTGSTISGSTNVKNALQELETSLETKAASADVMLLDGTQAMTADLNAGSNKIVSLADPTSAQDAATKAYVDAVAEGLSPKEAVRAATTAAGTLASDFENGDSLDGVTLSTGDRILIKDQAAPAENGIYIVEATGAPSRASDFDSLSPVDEINGAYVAVQEGTANAGKLFVQTGTVATIDTDAINFVFFNSNANLSGGDGIDLTGGVFSVDHDGEGLTFVSNQLALELDGTTLSKSASGLAVNEIANAQIAAAAAIDATKLADGSVTNAEFQFINTLTSNAQTQLNAKLENVVEDTTPQLGGALDLNGQSFEGEQRLAESGTPSRYYAWSYDDEIILTASTTAVASALTFNSTTIKARTIRYEIADGNDRRTGTLRVVANNAPGVAASDVSIIDEMNETADIGVTWEAAVNVNNIELSYTADAGNGNRTMRAMIESLQA